LDDIIIITPIYFGHLKHHNPRLNKKELNRITMFWHEAELGNFVE
jgi:hypothetical protein